MDDAGNGVDWCLGAGEGSDWLCELVDCGEVKKINT
jgi:hypothetical protein